MSACLLLCVICELKMVCAEQQPPDALASLLWLLEFFPEGESSSGSPGYPSEAAAPASGSSVCSGEALGGFWLRFLVDNLPASEPRTQSVRK